ncbi:conserved hypothetical protein [Neospora caninum Liverpool]|uniref:Uncharacterized protein n=1 Tax=Neospora caninum (strain Liverpool) TaxID=572307 RepID=F0VM62_NEOCL|nr:conserved hypothetical protein [Neospora caninum Liverpool]CBZ54340.1 conserved hypothetical protein [Neospora caninum Liverpool]CEL69045.1 TPA: hypothetical protein BN1204_047710 [Neospora caninum Liverpool]|eukprot:XP_003884371.1 conserved hypothetical protein [Neospora caninum Liverpool]
MSTRRLERLVLGAGGTFQNIKAVEFLLRKPLKENGLVKDFCTFFLPGIRYQNPGLSFQIFEAPESASSPAGSGDSDSGSASPASTASAVSPVGTGAQVAPAPLECVRLFFGEGTGSHVVNLGLYRSPHQLMQRLLDVDAQWQQLQIYEKSWQKKEGRKP